MAEAANRERGAALFVEGVRRSLLQAGVDIGSLNPVSPAAGGCATDDGRDPMDGAADGSASSCSAAAGRHLVVLGVGGAWHGAVAMRFDEAGALALATTMLTRAPRNDQDCAEALIEACNVAAGRGVAAMGQLGVVWLTPPVHARGMGLGVRLHNTVPTVFDGVLGGGRCRLLFAAAPKDEGNH